MKTLYLHCGYHKTGSSFLQTMFARNRDLLIENSIYYPRSEGELDMIQGNISPGNGQQLLDFLNSGNVESLLRVIEQGKNEATDNKCESLLFSSEGLFHAFPKEYVLSQLCEAAEEGGFKNIKALVYFRDPVSHALSTYKHRAKRGGHPDFGKWISENYETMGLIEKFVIYKYRYPIEWSCRKYDSNSVHMTASSFRDWLNVEAPEIPEDDRVNTSLTLSEIRVLQVLKNKFEGAIDFIYEEFSNIPQNHKSNDEALNQLYRSVATCGLVSYKELIDEVNKLLPPDENLVLDTVTDSNSSELNTDLLQLSLSEKEIEGMAAALLKAAKSNRMINKIGSYWKRGMNKIKRKVKAAGF